MSKDKALAHITECGIPGITSIPFGIHLCHFYPHRQDLIDSLVPYFKAGLDNNERCLWITAAPFPADEARAALRKVVPGLGTMIEEGRIRILDAKDWYADAEGLRGTDVVQFWLREEEKALVDGFQGLRIAGNTSFVTPEDWATFMRYEHAVTAAFQDRRIVALCSYNLHQCRATDVFEVIRNHHYTLDRRDVTWEVLHKAPA